MQEQAVLSTFSKKKVGRRKGGRGRQHRRIEWKSPQAQAQAQAQEHLPR